jgi:hypothetical protein
MVFAVKMLVFCSILLLRSDRQENWQVQDGFTEQLYEGSD